MRKTDRHEIICGIDPGLRHTGFGVIGKDGDNLRYFHSGTISPPPDESLAWRLGYLYDGLGEVLRAYAPSLVAVEEVFVSVNSQITLKLGHVRGVILLAARHNDCLVREFASTAVKKAIVGFGRAEKSQILAMVGMLLPLATPDSEHATDALAVAIACAHYPDILDAIERRRENSG